MAGNPSQGSGRIAIISPEAGLDIAAIYVYTYQIHGGEQAERYEEFLKSAINDLARYPQKGNRVAMRSGMFETVFKWKRAKHGHRVVYRITDTGIYVLRVLHTAMNWPDQLH